jgi:hypothetical protein
VRRRCSGRLPGVDEDDTAAGPEYTPAQQEVVDLLGCAPEDRPRFDPALRVELRASLEEQLADLALDPDLEERPVWVGKFHLKEVHGCEAKFMAEDQGFTPSAATARGTVAHKAIELTVNMPGETPPLELVDEAISRLAEADVWLSDWLRDCSDVDRAELRADVNELLVKFQDCWPPLRPQWRPVPESRLYADLCNGRVTLAGKVDLALGRAEGDRAGKVLVDLKTGRTAQVHREDLRFYALIETIRVGVPPRTIATHYLDSGTISAEEVTVDVLDAAVARTVDGTRRIAELRDPDRPLTKRPGPPCGWCALADGCEEGRAWLDDETRGGDF